MAALSILTVACEVGGGARAEPVGIVLQDVPGYPRMQLAASADPPASTDGFVLPLSAAVSKALQSCTGDDARDMTGWLELRFGVLDGRLSGPALAAEGMSGCLGQSLEGSVLEGLEGARTLTLRLRAAVENP